MAEAPPAQASGATQHMEYLDYTPATRWIIMGAVMLGTLMQMIDTSIVNVAIPTMMGNLGATLDEIAWVTTGYMLAIIIMLPLTAWLASVFGRRKYLAGSMAIFTIASLLCGISQSIGFLVFARILQGIGGAALVSTAQATMMEIFPPAQLAMVQSIYGLGVIVGPAIGPTLGGWIVDNSNWHWIFYINLPIGIVATLFTWSFMHDSKYARKLQGKIDLPGIALLAIGLGSLQLLLENGQKEGWFDSNYISALAVCTVLALVAFVWRELSIEHPVVNLRVLRHRGFAMGVIFGTMLGFALFGGMFILPVYLQQMQRYTALQTGMLMFPSAIATALVMPFTGRLLKRVSPRWLIAIGVIGTSVSMFMLCTLTTETGVNTLLWSLIVRGVAMAGIWVPLTLATLGVLRGPEIADGSSLYNLTRQLGGSIGIAVMTTFLTRRIIFHRSILIDNLTVYQVATHQRLAGMTAMLMSKGMSAPVAAKQAIALLEASVRSQASVLAYEDIFLMMGLIFLSTLVLLFFFEKGPTHANVSSSGGE